MKNNRQDMKETKKQIKAQLINEVNRMYEHKMEALQKSLDTWRNNAKLNADECHKATVEARKLERENNELKGKLAQYEEWVERMQDFCNLPEQERHDAFKTYLDGIKAKAEHDQAMASFGNMFSRLSSLFMY